MISHPLSQIRGGDAPTRLVGAVILLGVVFRIALWQLLFPIWKHFAAFTIYETSIIEYLGNFESYSAVRMPFYDVFALAVYLPTVDLFGVRAFSLYSVLVVIASLPAFYVATRDFLSTRVAVPALVLYAIYPKFAVLTAFGFPEASSVAYVSFSLYTLTRARKSDSVGWYAVAGILATLSFLMYVPAVAAAVMLSVYVYWTTQGPILEPRTLVPAAPSIAYNVVPFTVGVLYLVFGPVRDAFSTVSGEWKGMSSSVFGPGVNYGLGEKVVRYVAYMYADFWSFGRGFDKGSSVIRKFESFQSFSGELFPLLLAGYLVVTLALTVCLLYGFVHLAGRREAFSMLIVSWLVTYVALHNLKNLGWTGTFQWRHVFPILPAVAISFGVGVDQIWRRLEAATRSTRLPISVNVRTVAIVILLCLTPLAGVSTVDAHFAGNNVELSDNQPVDRLLAIAGPGADVGVVRVDAYRTVVLYTGNEIRPTILVPTNTDRVARGVETWTIVAEYRVASPTEIAAAGVDYLYISYCGRFSQRQRAYLNAAKKTGIIVYEWEKKRGAGRCTPRGAIVRLRSEE